MNNWSWRKIPRFVKDLCTRLPINSEKQSDIKLTVNVEVLDVGGATECNIALTKTQQLAVIRRCYADVEALAISVSLAQSRTLHMASKYRL